MIKFRAWDSENVFYLYNVQDYYGNLNATVLCDDGNGSVYDERCFGDFLDNKRYAVEQFTGLTDVNGKDIYVGDILENRKYRSIVKFGSGKFLADVVGTINKFDLIGETYSSKVVGNIHTRPELLEDK